MDYDEKIRLSDDEVREYIAKLRLQSSEIQKMDKDKKNEALRKLKAIDGITIRQLSRVTGISKSVIDRI